MPSYAELSRLFHRLRWVIALLGLLVTLQAQNGGAPGSFMALSRGARSIGMGGVTVGVLEDASAVLMTPGLLALLYDVQFNLTMGRLAYDRSYYDLALAYPLNRIGNIGLGWSQFGVDNITGRDQYGFLTHTFSDVESALSLSYARMLSDRLGFGISYKNLFHTLAGASARGYTLDGGASMLFGDHLTLAVVGQNLTSGINWNTTGQTREKIPARYAAGLAYYDPLGIDGLTLAADFGTQNGITDFHGGAEYLIANLLILRSGYSQDGLSFGGGVMYHGFKLDVAWAPEPIGAAHRLFFTLSWVITPSAAGEVAPAPQTGAAPLPQPETEQIQQAKQKQTIVLITDGPLKYEKAEIISSNVTANTVTVRLLALPNSEPVTLRLDQVEFVK